MRLDSNLSRPQNPNGNSATNRGSAKEEEARKLRYTYNRWAAARREQGARAGAQAADVDASSPPGASALCYANSLDFANFFCSDAVESDDDDGEHTAVNSKDDDDADMLTLTRSLAFGGSIDTDEDQHEGRMISLATTNTFESSKSEVSELRPGSGNNGVAIDGIVAADGTPTPRRRGSPNTERSANVTTPCASNKKIGQGQAVGTPNTCDITPPRSNSSSLASTPVSRQQLPQKWLEYDRSQSNAVVGTIPNSKNVNAVGKHVVTATDANSVVSSANPGAAETSTGTNDEEPGESGTELVLVHMSKSAAVL